MLCGTGDGEAAKRHPGSPRQNGLLLDTTYNTFTLPMDTKGDDDYLEDLCMGVKRSYDSKLKPHKFEVVGVNCGDDSFVEGDVFWTLYPKYELAY